MIQQKFPDNVEVEYVDFDDEDIDKYYYVLGYIDDPSVPLPIVTINEKPVQTGPMYFPKIFDELKKIIS